MKKEKHGHEEIEESKNKRKKLKEAVAGDSRNNDSHEHHLMPQMTTCIPGPTNLVALSPLVGPT